MSSKFETYYKEIRQRRAQLSGQFPENACLVVAAGCVTEVTLDIAARLLTENTHSLASDDQGRAFRETQTAARARSVPAETLDEVKRLFAATMRERGTRVS